MFSSMLKIPGYNASYDERLWVTKIKKNLAFAKFVNSAQFSRHHQNELYQNKCFDTTHSFIYNKKC